MKDSIECLLLDAKNLEERSRRINAKIRKHVASMGECLRVIRKAQGLSLRETSRLLGYSAAYVSDIELGRRKATVKFLEEFFRKIK